MATETLHIKNMVCNRCIKVLKDEFEKLDLTIESIELGKVIIATSIDNTKLNKVKQVLNENGFELIDDRKSKIIERIKTLSIELVHHNKEKANTINFSTYFSNELSYDYTYLSHLFSSVEGITIEKYIINQKIEKAKELLVYNELTINEISYQLGYSSVQHLSNQFKKTTGLTPSHFKKLKENKRKPIDQV